jgi:hypothetical protein
MKCKGCDRQHDITIQPFDSANAWVPDTKDGWCRLATFEVRQRSQSSLPPCLCGCPSARRAPQGRWLRDGGGAGSFEDPKG